jgi:plasmid stabilization system protein ParE
VTYRLLYRPEAVADIDGIYGWYEAQRPGLGNEFRAALTEIEGLLTASPGSFPEIRRGIRRVLLRRFPYTVYFRIQPDLVEVWACIHQSRHPRVARRRLREG